MKKVKKLNHRVLAEGEVTGHKHQLVGGDSVLWETDDADVLLLEVGGDSALVHEEHHAQEVSSGVYARRIVREYDHFREEARRVAD